MPDNAAITVPPTPCRGLFVVGTDTGVGKTYVAARIASQLVREGLRVGVYKPAASGCERDGDPLLSEDAVLLWQAAGKPGELEAVCPQRFAAPLAPHLAARAEGKEINPRLLRSGLDYWRKRSDIVIVEGAGGIMSPLGDNEYVIDLAAEFGYPLVIVAPNRIGVINAALLTLMAAATRCPALPIAALVLNDVLPPEAASTDPSIHTNANQLRTHCRVLLTQLRHAASTFDQPIQWSCFEK